MLLLPWLLFSCALTPQASGTLTVLRHWPLLASLPVLNGSAAEIMAIDDVAAGPADVMCKGMPAGDVNVCHDILGTCNQCRSNAPHVFFIQWCADTRGSRGISCDLDLGYRSAQGARYGHLAYSLRGRGSRDSDFVNASTQIFPDSPFAFSHFAVDSGKNDILTVFQLSMAEGNTDGDDLALTNTQGFCCRATFWGGKTTTGTLYIGDLNIRANAVVGGPSPSPPPPAAASSAAQGGYSPAAVTGGVAGGAVLGAALALGALAVAQFRATGALPAFFSLAGGSGQRISSGGFSAASASGVRADDRSALLAAARLRTLP